MAAEVGTTRQSIENLERGSVGLPHYLVKLADVMGMSIDEMLGRRRGYPTAQEPRANYGPPPLHAALVQVGNALEALPEHMRPAAAESLAGWARAGGAEHYRDLLLMLLQRSAAVSKS